jgi:peptidoglycan/LPS O-acetylase OafA/YrhL
VVAFHYTSRFPGYYPYKEITLFQHGYLGVHLFFVISGFVIASSLLPSRSVVEFGIRRLARLVPPMIVCSLITFATLTALDNPFADLRRANPLDFLPSWSFTHPAFWKWMDGDIKYVDGVYWSLFYEVRFYLWAVVMFFLLPKERFAASFAWFTAFSWLGYMACSKADNPVVALTFETAFASKYLPLFCAGVLFHELYAARRRPWTLPAIGACLLAAMTERMEVVDSMVLGSIFTVFFILVYRPTWLALLAYKPLTAIGVVSYSLYLLHQNAGIALMNALPLSGYATIIPTAAVVLGTASLVYWLVERNSSRWAKIVIAHLPQSSPKQPLRPQPAIPL